MSGPVSERYLDIVANALPSSGPGATPETIHAAIRVGARSTIRHALAELRRRDRVRVAGKPTKMAYWRVD
jgi:hypothetical protein